MCSPQKVEYPYRFPAGLFFRTSYPRRGSVIINSTVILIWIGERVSENDRSVAKLLRVIRESKSSKVKVSLVERHPERARDRFDQT